MSFFNLLKERKDLGSLHQHSIIYHGPMVSWVISGPWESCNTSVEPVICQATRWILIFTTMTCLWLFCLPVLCQKGRTRDFQPETTLKWPNIPLKELQLVAAWRFLRFCLAKAFLREELSVNSLGRSLPMNSGFGVSPSSCVAYFDPSTQIQSRDVIYYEIFNEIHIYDALIKVRQTFGSCPRGATQRISDIQRTSPHPVIPVLLCGHVFHPGSEVRSLDRLGKLDQSSDFGMFVKAVSCS